MADDIVENIGENTILSIRRHRSLYSETCL